MVHLVSLNLDQVTSEQTTTISVTVRSANFTAIVTEKTATFVLAILDHCRHSAIKANEGIFPFGGHTIQVGLSTIDLKVWDTIAFANNVEFYCGSLEYSFTDFEFFPFPVSLIGSILSLEPRAIDVGFSITLALTVSLANFPSVSFTDLFTIFVVCDITSITLSDPDPFNYTPGPPAVYTWVATPECADTTASVAYAGSN
jgi:hypothetical protein